jgi:hypothetical protein
MLVTTILTEMFLTIPCEKLCFFLLDDNEIDWMSNLYGTAQYGNVLQIFVFFYVNTLFETFSLLSWCLCLAMVRHF